LLERTDIAEVYRHIDIFMDLSWWQAFGRAAVEAMACGVVAVMPLTGAARDICGGDGEYCLYHDGK
jgi:glycosyltransferase involved in cell wall biosynthesis